LYQLHGKSGLFFVFFSTTEPFLSLGVVFGSLTIPLALDGQLTSAIRALEGAAMVWVGVRQNRLHARLFALLLQSGAACLFLAEVWYPFGAPAFLNHFFFGCLFITLAALFSSYYLERFRDRLRNWERFLPLPLLPCRLLSSGVRSCAGQQANSLPTTREWAVRSSPFCC
jgi:uncharacterized membrane protein